MNLEASQCKSGDIQEYMVKDSCDSAAQGTQST